MIHGGLATGLLLLALLASIALGAGDRPALAALAMAALGARLLLARRGVREAFGAFAAPLDLTLELALTLLALWLTGGLRSELVFLPLANIVLARRSLGAPGARFLAVATVLGLGLLAVLPSPAGAAPAGGVVLALRVLWPLALLAALELRIPAAEEARTPEPRPPAPPAPSAAERDVRREILHDLRSPLSVVRVYADLISERARRGEAPLEEHLGNLSAEIELMELLVDSTDLGPSGGSPSRPARPDLTRLLGALVESYRLAHSDKLTIEFVPERPELRVDADPVALQRVFRNVLDNAVQYTPPGGRVRVRAGVSGPQAFVVVSDTGAGMSPEELERAFEYSYRGSSGRASRAEGSGLGLALSREVLERNGGRITITSDEGRGSDVRILLPLAPEGRS